MIHTSPAADLPDGLCAGRLIAWDTDLARGTAAGGIRLEIARPDEGGALRLHEDGAVVDAIDLGPGATARDIQIGRLHLAGVAERRAAGRLPSPDDESLALAAAEAARVLEAALTWPRDTAAEPAPGCPGPEGDEPGGAFRPSA